MFSKTQKFIQFSIALALFFASSVSLFAQTLTITNPTGGVVRSGTNIACGPKTATAQACLERPTPSLIALTPAQATTPSVLSPTTATLLSVGCRDARVTLPDSP